MPRVAYIPLIHGGHAKIDAYWYERLAHIRWREHRGYARSNGLFMHRLVAGIHPLERVSDLEVHHRNGDKLDNRVSNLYLCSAADHRAIHAGTRCASDLILQHTMAKYGRQPSAPLRAISK